MSPQRADEASALLSEAGVALLDLLTEAWVIAFMKGAMVLLFVVWLLSGCASEHGWVPVEAEQGLVYGSSCRPPAERWPVASVEYYRVTSYYPEETKAVNENSKWEYIGKRIEFDPWLAHGDGPSRAK